MSDRGYKNTIYLKNGETVSDENAENLAEKMRIEDDWSRGSVFLRSDSSDIIIPKYNISAINSEIEGADE